MPEDYKSAAIRHTMTAKAIINEHPDDAGYLAGYGVECSIKSLLQCAGGFDLRALGRDLATLHGLALTLAVSISAGLGRYQVAMDEDVVHTIAHWKPELRYEATGMLSTASAEKFLKAAEACVEKILYAMILDGRDGV